MTKRVRHDIYELIDRQLFRWREDALAIGESELPRRPADKPPMGPYVSLSRDFGCGALIVGGLLSEKLGWQVYDRQIVDEVASEAHLRRSVVESFDEHHQNWIAEYINNLTFMGELSEQDFFRHLVKVVTSIGSHGKAILIGRGCQFILPAERGVRVRLIAAFEPRVQWIAHRNKLDLDEARQLARQSDAERENFVRRHYNRDVHDPAHYDRVFDVSQMTHEAIAAAVLDLLERKLGIYLPGRTISRPATHAHAHDER
ncbi:MAG: cytidylate kinase-like family protein [Candidatus Wallbacteria bacterium]|nr:cytidylate kinase-like family protein [Candidatus Wallbacteria bacterium]